MKHIFFLFFLALSISVNAQVSINTDGSLPDNSSMLDVKSTTKGMLVPRMNTAQRSGIASPAAGLLVFDNTTNSFWYYNGAGWEELVSGNHSPDQIADADGNTKIMVEQNPNEDKIRFDLGGAEKMVLVNNRLELINPENNIFIGGHAGLANTTGVANTVTGNEAFTSNISGSWNTAVGYSSMYYNTSGQSNTAIGINSLRNNTTGYNNTAIGTNSLIFNTTGSSSTAAGSNSLFNNSTGYWNTAFGESTLYSNISGYSNTANGFYSLNSNTTGYDNTAFGILTLAYNTTGFENTATGSNSLRKNTTGAKNTANGIFALYNNTTGSSNIAIGSSALYSNTNRSNIVAIGDSTLVYNGIGALNDYDASFNTAVGSKSLKFNTTGYGNTANGYEALKFNTTGYNNTANGYRPLFYNTAGDLNAANGYAALYSNTTGNENTANGALALYSNTYGGSNTAIGANALYVNTTGFYNTALGVGALQLNSTGYGNTAIGYYSGPLGDAFTNTIALGYGASVDASDKAMIGDFIVSSIGGFAGWTTWPSDGAFKKNVYENVPGLAFISQLRPVTYSIDVNAIGEKMNRNRTVSLREGEKLREETPEERESADAKSKIIYSGFIAQEVEAAAKSIGYDFSGVDKPQNENGLYGLRYAEFVVPLVKAVQELSAINEAHKITNEEMKQNIEQLIAQNEKLMQRIEKLESK